jgi:hypothetical protein
MDRHEIQEKIKKGTDKRKTKIIPDRINPTTKPLSERDELRKKLKDNLYQKNTTRMTKTRRDGMIEKNMESMGIDMERLKNSLEIINKAGGLSLNIKQ